MKIAGSRVLVTGASRGIGAELARGFRAAGAQVALVARGADSLSSLADQLNGRAYPTDLTNRAELRELLDRVEADGPVDIVVNNAATRRLGRSPTWTPTPSSSSWR
jgi:uncharacterized protein